MAIAFIDDKMVDEFPGLMSIMEANFNVIGRRAINDSITIVYIDLVGYDANEFVLLKAYKPGPYKLNLRPVKVLRTDL